jgi:hypothetical protein
MKRPIRRFAVWLYHTTNYWVVSREMHEAIVSKKFFARYWVTEKLRLAEAQWPGDPEVTRAQALFAFLNEP